MSVLEQIYLQALPFVITEGQNQTKIPYCTVLYSSDTQIQIPDSSDPFLYLVINGTLRIFAETGISDYSAGNYLISSIDGPMTAKIFHGENASPFLAVCVAFSADEILDVLLDIDPGFLKTLFEQDSAENSGEKTDDVFLQTVLRLFRIEAGQEKLGFLYPHLKRELIYDLITGPQGNIFVQNVVKIQQAGDIYYTNQWIRQNYKNSFSVADLAGQRNMSVSSFHQKFKSAIGMGPLQCQKKLRLIEARKLMLDGNCNVTKAATEVGYDSLSQFNRDYRKLFGASPQKDMQKIKTYLKKV